jgi:hypothetical protein
MRTILYMTLALGLAAGGFALYLRMQGPVTAMGGGQTTYVSPMDVSRPVDPSNPMGPGSRPSFKKIDRFGRLASKISCRDYDNLPGNRIQVREPIVEFYQYIRVSNDPADPRLRTQRVKMVGASGLVELAQTPKAPGQTGFESGGMGAPKRGTLRDVIIQITPELQAAPLESRVSVTITTPNISFDNETYEITTESYRREDGTLVPADQVPVHADGDYEFRGKGLTLQTNDVDGRLELLEIAHGEYLYIKDRSALGNGMFPGGGPALPETTPASPDTRPANPVAVGYGGRADFIGPLTDAAGEPIRLAAGDKVTAARAAKDARTGKAKKLPQPPYRASFDHDIRVSQGVMNQSEVELAQADELHLEFQPSGRGSTTRPSTTQPSATRPTAVVDVPATAPTPPAAADNAPRPTKPGTTRAAATRPAAEPLIVRWTGKLRVTPIVPGETFTGTAMKPGESVLRLVGTNLPVRLRRENGRVECARADYFSADGSVAMFGSEKFGNVVMRQMPDPAAGDRGSTIVTESMHYNGLSRVATLHGVGHANMALPATRPASGPAAPTQPAVAQTLDARWSRMGQLFMKEGLAGSMTFDRAVFQGDVDVRHPQMALKSQSLDLQFEDRAVPASVATPGKPSPTTRRASESVLKELIATTDVWCDLADPSGRRQTITTDRLLVQTENDAAGRMYPRRVIANGDAHAWDPTQDLRAGNVELTLAPPPPATPTTVRAVRPATDRARAEVETASVELQSMRAWDGVNVRSADGSTAVGQQMDVTMVAGQPIARIIGTPVATVTDAKGSVVSGPVIDFDAARQVAVIPAAGSIRAIQMPDPVRDPKTGQPLPTQPARPGRPIDIAWAGSAELNSAQNQIIVAGPLSLTTRDPDGSVLVAKGNRARIELIDRPPTTQPTSQPTAVAGQGPRPSTGPSAKPSAMPGVAKMNFMENKAVSVVHLEQDAVVNSTLSDATGILRQFEIKSQTIRYEMGAANASPLAMNAGGQGRIIAPDRGTLLYRDHRPPTTAPAKPAAGQPPEQTQPDQARGATAFRWDKSLVVDQSAKQAVMDGNVAIVHQSDEPASLPVRVFGDQATALFDSRPPTTNRTTLPAGSPTGDGDMAVQLRWLTIAGSLVIQRGDATLTADRMDYDPASGWLTAVGSPRNPATWQDATRSGFVDQVQWNTRNWLPRLSGFRGRSGTEPPKPAAAPAPAAPAPAPAGQPAPQPAPQPAAKPKPKPLSTGRGGR